MSNIEKNSPFCRNFSLSNYLYTKADIVVTEINSKIHKLDEPYDALIKESSSFFQEICPENLTFDYFYLYHYMLKHGYFSLKPFQFKAGGPTDLAGPVVMSGKGNCRHVSSFYCDILHEINATSDQFIAASPILVNFSPLLDLEIRNTRMAVLVSDGKSYTIQDPTNNLVYSVNGLLEKEPTFSCQSILKNQGIVIYPESFMAYAGLSRGTTDYYLYQMDQSNSPSIEELKEIKKKMKQLCKSNESAFEAFYIKNREIIEEISDRVRK